jgi:hypothetical protein
MNYVEDNAPTMTIDDTSEVMALRCRSALFAFHIIQIYSDKVHNMLAPAWGIVSSKRKD